MTRAPRSDFRGRHLAAVMLAIAVAGCSPGGDKPTSAAPTPADAAPEPAPEPPREGELLLAGAPDGWKVTDAVQTDKLRLAEYGPPDESDGRIERLTLEAQKGDPLPDPINFVLGVSKDLESRCEGFQDLNVSSGLENGYPTSVELLICGKFKDSEHGQVMMTKAIQGREKFYVITRRLLTPPMKGQGPPLTAQAMANWTVALKHVRVCDTRGDEHPCPP